jgi:hypothetical protein
MKNYVHFFTISRSILLKMRNVSAKSCRDKQNTRCRFRKGFYENRAVYEIMKNTVEPGRPHMTILRVLIACWIPKATNTLSEYVKPTDFHCKGDCKNAPQHYVMRTVPILLQFYIGDLPINKDATTSSETLVTSRISTKYQQASCLKRQSVRLVIQKCQVLRSRLGH